MLQSKIKSSTSPSDFPVPDEIAFIHSNQLKDRISTLIEKEGGAINFSRFMQAALYEPGLGYYSAGAIKLGQAGDFITAPEVSSLFSYCLARQCEQILRDMKNDFILELGAGTGRMAGDIMLNLADGDNLPEEYLILEVSADLGQRQQQFLQQYVPPELYERFRWLDALPELPINGVVLANEVMDALPVERIHYEKGEYEIMQVSYNESGFIWSKKLVDQKLVKQVQSILSESQAQLPDGYVTEINTQLSAWVGSLADVLEQGLILLVDYGYPRSEFYHPQRAEGTLLCHYQHRAHNDPFLYVGLQDITASVDFTAVAEAASLSGLSVNGYCSQAHFLLSCGLDKLVTQYSDNDGQTLIKLSGEVKKLTLPAEMGERFKAIALGRGLNESLLGFRMFDHREKL